MVQDVDSVIKFRASATGGPWRLNRCLIYK